MLFLLAADLSSVTGTLYRLPDIHAFRHALRSIRSYLRMIIFAYDSLLLLHVYAVACSLSSLHPEAFTFMVLTIQTILP